MSKSSELDKNVKAYILSGIDPSNYGEEANTEAEKIAFLHQTFMAEYGWQVERVGLVNALREWLSGLPSSCNVEFRNHELLEISKQWGSIPEGVKGKKLENLEDKIIENWFNLLANKTAQLFRKHKLV